MAFSMNKVILIGNVGGDPELKTTPSGSQVCTISLATTENYKDKNGEWKDSTEWHRVVMWDYLAERTYKFVKKGSKICIEGKNKTRSYEKDGVTHYMTEVLAKDMILLDPKQGTNDSFDRQTPKQADSSFDIEIESKAGPFSAEDDIPF